MMVKVHCAMCAFLTKERESVSERRAKKKAKREKRKQKLQRKLEDINMAKKKASAKVVKKSALKKPGKVKKEKKGRVRKGRGWYMPSYLATSEAIDNFVVGENKVLAKILEHFQNADMNVVFENELVTALEKSGIKAEGKKTVKKLIKAALRNLSRAGVIGKERDRRREEKAAKKAGKLKKKDEDDDDEEETDEEESDDEDADEDDEEEADDEEDEEPAPKKKKNILKKKKK